MRMPAVVDFMSDEMPSPVGEGKREGDIPNLNVTEVWLAFVRTWIRHAAMPVHIHAPGAPLDQFVENFWSVMQHPSAWPKERILPDSGVEMIFNLGAPQRLHDRDGNGRGKVFRTCWFSGPRTESIVIGPTEFARLRPTEYLQRRGDYLNYVRVD